MNYNTEIILNPIDTGITSNSGLVDFSIDVFIGSNVVFTGHNSDSPDWNNILNKPYIPQNVSDLYNDVNFITLNEVPAQVNSDWNSSSGASNILNKPTVQKISYQPTAPENPQINDIWVSSQSLIQYQWIGAWVNFNLQSLINL